MNGLNKGLLKGLAVSSALLLGACSSEGTATTNSELSLNELTLEEIETQAKEEGHVESDRKSVV